MGVVYEAEHLDLAERVALKFLCHEYMRNAEIVERFLREAKSQFRLHSDHVVRVLDVGRAESGAPYFVMELLDGVSFDRVLAERGRLPVAEAIDVVRQACSALAAAHALGIVHRDVKPGNLMLTRRTDGSSCVKLLDFGIAHVRSAAEQEPAARLTRTESVIGTPAYMPPEQLRSASAADARSDIWSIGVVLYELVTGALPFVADSPADLVMKQNTEPHVPMDRHVAVPRELADIVARCLSVSPAARFQTAKDLASALEQVPSSVAGPVLEPAIPNRAGLTFAKHKIRATDGHTIFEQHELVERSQAPMKTEIVYSTPVDKHKAPPRHSPPVAVVLAVAVGALLGFSALAATCARRPATTTLGRAPEPVAAAVAPPPSTVPVADSTPSPILPPSVASPAATAPPRAPSRSKAADTASAAPPARKSPPHSLYDEKW
jgi:serine/threonine-protein kinase